jgi:hypothetical protein
MRTRDELCMIGYCDQVEAAMNESVEQRHVGPADAASVASGFMVCLSGYPQSGVLPLADAQILALRLQRRHPLDSLSLYEVESRIHFEWIL